jgi:hypothetical protein
MGRWQWWLAVGLLVGAGGCATGRPAARPAAAVAPARAVEAVPASLQVQRGEGRRYVDDDLGFQVVRPADGWALNAVDDVSRDGLQVPVVLKHQSGATVVLQLAPAVATPFQYAEKLTRGLREQLGVEAGEVEPLPLSESAVGFRFRMGAGVRGRVAVREGSPGRVFMMLATWPESAPASVPANIDTIIDSVRPVGTARPPPKT